MERRKFLIGTGALASGSAAAMGTGAFTSVVANRDISISTTGDASALLEIRKDVDNREGEEGDRPVTPNAQEYVTIEEDDTVSLDLADANKDADVLFGNLLRVTNGGTQIVRVAVDIGESTLPDGLTVFAEGPTGDGDLTPKDDVQPSADDPGEEKANYDYAETTGNPFKVNGESVDDNPVHLESGETVEGISLSWDNGITLDDDTDYELVISAEALSPGQPGDQT